MTAITRNRLERSTATLRTNVGHGKRCATDKYWSLLLFTLIFIIWTTAQLRVVPNNSSITNGTSEFVCEKTDCKIDSENRTTTISTSEFVYDEKGYKKNSDSITTRNYTYENVSRVQDRSWVLDEITCNVAFLHTHYEKSGSIVIWANVLFCICLIAYSFTSMYTNEMYHREQLLICSVYLIMFTQLYRAADYRIAQNSTISSSFDGILPFWIIPEVILLNIVCAMPSSNSDDPGSANDDIKIIHLGTLTVYVLMYFMLLVIIFIQFVSGKGQIIQINWDKDLLLLFLGMCCYIYLIIYYFGLMVISYATNISFDKGYPCPLAFVRAIFIVARYHFGIACYHATLIFPRIHATFVMNEKEFKDTPKLSVFSRFYLTHWKIHDLSLMMTGVRGHNYSRSIRELLRLFTSDSTKLKNFQSHSQIFRSCLALLMAINALSIILLWAHGVVLDPVFSGRTWIMYLFGMFFTYIMLKWSDAAWDTVWYRDDGSVVIKY